eukprot:20285-Heterococcus_DN1.PRE.2
MEPLPRPFCTPLVMPAFSALSKCWVYLLISQGSAHSDATVLTPANTSDELRTNILAQDCVHIGLLDAQSLPLSCDCPRQHLYETRAQGDAANYYKDDAELCHNALDVCGGAVQAIQSLAKVHDEVGHASCSDEACHDAQQHEQLREGKRYQNNAYGQC